MLFSGSRASTHAQRSTIHQTQKSSNSTLIVKCYEHAKLSHSKTHTLVQHIIPILTPTRRANNEEALKSKPPTIHLTKAERKRHRKLRRAECMREQQDLQAAGLIPPPEPLLTLSNYMNVLSDQAILGSRIYRLESLCPIQSPEYTHSSVIYIYRSE